jgi:hypothetical protein
VVQVKNADVTLRLGYSLEVGYDWVYVRTTEGGGSYETIKTGTAPGVQIGPSKAGYVRIRVTTDDSNTLDSPVSFSWTSKCKSGYFLLGGACMNLPLNNWVACDAGQIVDSAVFGCSPCAGGTYSETGWVAQIFA